MTAAVATNRTDVPWWLVLINGICALLIGILLLINPAKTSIILVQFIGIYWLISGIFSLVRIFVGDSDIHWGWLLFNGILGIIAGFIVINHPLWSPVMIGFTLAIILGVYGLIGGVISLIEAFTGGFKWGALILGIISIIFGFILLGSPWITALVLPWVVGIWAIVGGIMAIVVSFKLR